MTKADLEKILNPDYFSKETSQLIQSTILAFL
jgi:hypothetical protein